MKYNFKNFILIFGLILLSVLSKVSSSQTTNCSLLNGTYIGTIAPTSGSTFVTYPNFGPGYYFLTPVLNGGSYAISTCGASIDTQITVWGGFNTNMLLYNDDNGPYCTGSNASGNFVPNLTNYAYMFISEYPCLQGGSASINVFYRQNNNEEEKQLVQSFVTQTQLNNNFAHPYIGSASGALLKNFVDGFHQHILILGFGRATMPATPQSTWNGFVTLKRDTGFLPTDPFIPWMPVGCDVPEDGTMICTMFSCGKPWIK